MFNVECFYVLLHSVACKRISFLSELIDKLLLLVGLWTTMFECVFHRFLIKLLPRSLGRGSDATSARPTTTTTTPQGQFSGNGSLGLACKSALLGAAR